MGGRGGVKLQLKAYWDCISRESSSRCRSPEICILISMKWLGSYYNLRITRDMATLKIDDRISCQIVRRLNDQNLLDDRRQFP